MRPRVISFLRHDLTAKQALALALEMWRENRELPIMLVVPKGQTEAIVKAIRVAFSKEKKATKQSVYYGFRLSEPFPYTDEGITGEAVVMNWHMTPLQNFKNINLLSNANLKERIHGGVQ